MSKIALISDIHGNLPALKAVLELLEKEQPDTWVCLGDLVGYGPHINECIEEVRSRNMICVMGNHDAGVTEALSLNHFRNPNRKLIELTRKLINTEHKRWLSTLPFVTEDPGMERQWIAAHASPEEPEKWEYIESAFSVRDMLPKLEHLLCFVGHTHRPAFVADTLGLNKFQKGHKYFINPGSVGQSRDGDSRASCAFIDTANFSYKNIRVAYDVAPVIADLEKMGFSQKEAERMMHV